MDLLGNIAWVFNDTKYATIDAFSKAVSEYQDEIMKDRASWNPDEVIIDAPTFKVQYMAWIKDANSLTENETLLEDDDFFDDPDNSDDGLFQAEIIAQFNADNGKNVPAKEVLYKLHHLMQTKELGDHVFFEGLQEDDSHEDVPCYQMYCGS